MPWEAKLFSLAFVANEIIEATILKLKVNANNILKGLKRETNKSRTSYLTQ